MRRRSRPTSRVRIVVLTLLIVVGAAGLLAVTAVFGWGLAVADVVAGY